MRIGFRGLRPPRTPGVLAPEYGPVDAIELPMLRIAELASRAGEARRR